MKGLKKNFWPLFSLTLIVCSFFWKVFLKNEVPIPGDFIVGVYFPWLDYKWGFPAGVPVKNPITTDVISFTYPMQTFAINLLKNGQWPLWNPYILAGSPLFANFQSAPFSPTSFLYFLFNMVTAWSIQIILQHVLAAVFTYMLLRSWKVSKFGSILGGIIYAYSGYNVIFSQWNGHTLAAAFIPLVLFFADKLMQKRKIAYGVGLAFALAMQFVSGYTQTSVYTALAIGILWLVRSIKAQHFFSKTTLLAIFCFLSLGLSAVQILPSIELIENSQRSFEPHPFEWAFLPWSKTITLIAADYFGNHATHNYWGPQDYTSNTAFVGVVGLVLSLIPITLLKKDRSVLFSYLLLLSALVLSFPTPIATFIWENDILGMKANSAHRATVLVTVAVAFLAGFGYDALSITKGKVKLIAIFIPAILLIGFGIYAPHLHRSVALRNLILPTAILLATAFVMFIPRLRGLLLLFIVVELFYFGFKYTPFSPRNFIYPETPIITFLKAQSKPFRTTGARVIPSNIRMAYGIEAIEGYDTFHPLYISRFISAINSGTSNAHPVGRYGIVDNDISPLLDLANTKYYLTLNIDGKVPKKYDSQRFKKVFEDRSVSILESTSAQPRAFVVYDWEVIIDEKQVLDKLLAVDYPYSKKIILQDTPTLQKSDYLTSTVEYVNYGTQNSLIKIDTKNNGLLFVSDAYYPGWKAYVDGKEIKIYRANYMFRAIEVPKGQHEVQFTYQPESFYLGLRITLFSLLILLLALGYTWLYD